MCTPGTLPPLLHLLLVLLSLSLTLPTATAERIYTITNNCPGSPIPLLINGKSHGTIPSKKSVTKSFARGWDGFIYTSANGGTSSEKAKAKGKGATRAGFYGESDYYYIVQDPKKFNTGISIVPKVNGTDGFCVPDICDIRNCTTAFTSTPTRFPGPETTAPTSPLFSCQGKKVGYTVTFCPSGYLPPPKGAVSIHPADDRDKCLDVRQSVFENGAPVQIYDCNQTPAQRWFVKKGSTAQIRLAGTSFCLDAGKVHDSKVPVKIWKCREGNDNQQWRHDSAENKIWLADTEFALDLKDGNLTNTNIAQIYVGYPNATNQMWTIDKFWFTQVRTGSLREL